MKLAALILLTVSSGLAVELQENPLKVTLFYETYCPDCIQYIGDKLQVAWISFKNHIVVDLVPFGNAVQKYVDGHWEFICQHGEKECQGNKLHACAIKQACGTSGTSGCAVDKLGKVIDFILCVIRKPDQLLATKGCANDTGLDGDSMITCVNSEEGERLLNFYGNQTTAFQPSIQYVPTVAINGKHDVAAEEDLVGEICKLRPALCATALPQVVNL